MTTLAMYIQICSQSTSRETPQTTTHFVRTYSPIGELSEPSRNDLLTSKGELSKNYMSMSLWVTYKKDQFLVPDPWAILFRPTASNQQ